MSLRDGSDTVLPLSSKWVGETVNRTAEDLLPIMHPLYNLREICKQMALLEDHLNNERKRCQDCIRKHFLTIEALFEEAISLDNKGKWADKTDGKADEVREFQTRWIDGEDPRTIAQEIRAIRKDFAKECFDLRGMTEESRMASSLVDRYMARGRHVCGSSNPIHDLRKFLGGLYEAIDSGEDINAPQNRVTLAKLMREADEALTGKPMTGRPPYDDYARQVLELDPVVMHLADGGYSRLVVSLLEEPFVWLNVGSSLPTVVQNWNRLKG